jgi:hypothetical protein
MVDFSKFEYYLNKLLPGSLEVYVGNSVVEPIKDIRLLHKFQDFFLNNSQVKAVAATSIERYVIQAAKESFALGFFSVKQVSDKGFGIETKPDEFLDDIIQLVSSTSAWRAAFENQNLSDINTIGVKIQMAQDGILMSFPQEFKHEEYMRLYMQYYYYMGVMFGKRV